MAHSRAAAALLVTAVLTTGSFAQPPDAALDAVRFDQRLEAALPLDAAFVDEQGRAVRLGDYFHDRPVVVALVQLRCAMLCTLVLDGLAQAVRHVPLKAGRDYDVLVISIDPRETPEHAAKMTPQPGWHVLTGQRSAIDAVAATIGYGYHYDAGTDQFAHPSGIVLVTPDGQVSQYIMGVAYPPRSLRLGLVAASNGRIGSVVDGLMLRCFAYDSHSGQYTLTVMSIVRGGVLVTVALMAAGLTAMVRHRRGALPEGGA